MRDFVIIQAKKIGLDVWYRAAHVQVESAYSKFQPLVYVENDPMWFLTYAEADAVKDRYENEGCGEWRERRWDYGAGEWEITVAADLPRGHRGEDFHADDGL